MGTDEEKKYCVHCGAALNGARFCGRCGYDSETGGSKTGRAKRVLSPDEAAKRWKMLFYIIPGVTLLLASLGTLLSMFLPAATALGVHMGSVYYQTYRPILAGNGFSDWMSVCAKALIFICVVFFFLAASFLAGSKEYLYAKTSGIGRIVLLFLLFAFPVAPAAVIAAFLTSVGLQPGTGIIITIVIWSVAAVGNCIAAFIAYNFCKANQPPLTGKSKRAAMFQELMTAFLIIIIMLLLYSFAIFVPKHYEKANVRKGDDRKYVERALGKPLEDNGSVWVYYDKNYTGLAKAIDKTGDFENMESFEDLEKMAELSLQLEEVLDNLVYRRVTICFDENDKVWNVQVDTECRQ